MQIELDSDAALVLFELLASRTDRIVAALQLASAERNALRCLHDSFERTLGAPLDANYGTLLAKARNSLVERLGE